MAPSRETTRATEARRLKEAVRDLLLAYRAHIEDTMRPLGITLPQLRALHAIGERQDVSAATIARHCQVTPQTLQSILTRLTREGWIVRGSSERNHRIVTATLTEAGQAMLAKATQTSAAIDEQIWRGVSLESMEAVRVTIEKGLGNLHGHQRTKGEPERPHPKG